jgi:XTP/dITP diphosphohydrolase
MQRLLEVMRKLRAPDGCPWDREQTHLSLRPYLLEEACEAIDAISSGDSEQMTEELGDVLLQVAFHAVIAEEAGAFSYEAIENSIVEKLIRRHPHVFGEITVDDSAEVVRNWQQIKKAEKGKGARPPAERVPRSLPALARACELGEKLGWEEGGPEKVAAALEGEERENVGILLLAMVDYARALGVNPETALREAADARAADAT